jgi:ATP-dependent Clp protease ATP-binding subunit ClpC
VFERFTDQARRAVVLAEESARRLSHSYLGTEHLLLGLVRSEGGVAHRALDLFEVDDRRAETEIEALVGRGGSPAGTNLPLTTSARQALERSRWECRQLHHARVGTEHVLLGLLQAEDSIAVRVLVALTVDPDKLRTAVLQLVEAGEHDADAAPVDDLDAGAVEAEVLGAPADPPATPEPPDRSVAGEVARLRVEVAALRTEIRDLALLVARALAARDDR